MKPTTRTTDSAASTTKGSNDPTHTNVYQLSKLDIRNGNEIVAVPVALDTMSAEEAIDSSQDLVLVEKLLVDYAQADRLLQHLEQIEAPVGLYHKLASYTFRLESKISKAYDVLVSSNDDMEQKIALLTTRVQQLGYSLFKYEKTLLDVLQKCKDPHSTVPVAAENRTYTQRLIEQFIKRLEELRGSLEKRIVGRNNVMKNFQIHMYRANMA